jgi:hypothetical protein
MEQLNIFAMIECGSEELAPLKIENPKPLVQLV